MILAGIGGRFNAALAPAGFLQAPMHDNVRLTMPARLTRLLSRTRTAAVAAMLLCAGVRTAPAAELEVLHYWNSGEYAETMTLLRERLAARGHAWKDFSGIDDHGATAAVLGARIAAGNAPAAVQLMPLDAIARWGRAGALGGLDAVARAEAWDQRLPHAVAAALKYRGSYIAVPVHAHRNHSLWIYPAIFRQSGV